MQEKSDVFALLMHWKYISFTLSRRYTVHALCITGSINWPRETIGPPFKISLLFPGFKFPIQPTAVSHLFTNILWAHYPNLLNKISSEYPGWVVVPYAKYWPAWIIAIKIKASTIPDCHCKQNKVLWVSIIAIVSCQQWEWLHRQCKLTFNHAVYSLDYGDGITWKNFLI